MNLTDLKLSKKEIKEEHEYKPSELAERYPWGLHISLDSVVVEKLGVSGLASGEEIDIFAKATVSSINTSDDEENGKKTRMGIQITSLGIESDKSIASIEDKANRLYTSRVIREET